MRVWLCIRVFGCLRIDDTAAVNECLVFYFTDSYVCPSHGAESYNSCHTTHLCALYVAAWNVVCAARAAAASANSAAADEAASLLFSIPDQVIPFLDSHSAWLRSRVRNNVASQLHSTLKSDSAAEMFHIHNNARVEGIPDGTVPMPVDRMRSLSFEYFSTNPPWCYSAFYAKLNGAKFLNAFCKHLNSVADFNVATPPPVEKLANALPPKRTRTPNHHVGDAQKQQKPEKKFSPAADSNTHASKKKKLNNNKKSQQLQQQQQSRQAEEEADENSGEGLIARRQAPHGIAHQVTPAPTLSHLPLAPSSAAPTHMHTYTHTPVDTHAPVHSPPAPASPSFPHADDNNFNMPDGDGDGVHEAAPSHAAAAASALVHDGPTPAPAVDVAALLAAMQMVCVSFVCIKIACTRLHATNWR